MHHSCAQYPIQLEILQMNFLDNPNTIFYKFSVILQESDREQILELGFVPRITSIAI